MNSANRSPQRIAGFSMLELLIAILVLVVGILGVAMLQSVAKRGVFESSQRTLATSLANDILERMRTNPSQALLSSYDGSFGGGSLSAPRDCAGFAAACTSAETAAYDLYQWELMLDGASVNQAGANIGGLTSAAGCIEQSAGNVTVVIAWHGLAEMSDAAADGSDFAKACGTADAYRRQLVVETFISQ